VATPTNYRLITMVHSFAMLMVSKIFSLRLAPQSTDLISANFKFIQRVVVQTEDSKNPPQAGRVEGVRHGILAIPP
jgi:hypothetical protein